MILSDLLKSGNSTDGMTRLLTKSQQTEDLRLKGFLLQTRRDVTDSFTALVSHFFMKVISQRMLTLVGRSSPSCPH